ncbi:MAG TPA: hypothetical protein VFW06_07630 [Acidimicrobiia bacterium]|nr:hypothetical protein [Acidimicrobiia bacterium]
MFDNLRYTYTEWASADGSVPIPLPDGRILWLFGDTYIGKVVPGGAISPATQLEHNSFVVQTGRCFAPQMGGGPFARTERIADPAPGEFYWPASGVVDGSTVQVFLYHVRNAPPPLNFTILGMRLATLSLPGLAVQSITNLPVAAPPGVFYGVTTTLVGSTVYVYGHHDRSAYVARAPLAQLATPGAWEYWGNSGSGGPDSWGADPGRAVPLGFSGMPYIHPAFGAGAWPLAVLSVQAYGTGYLGTAKLVDACSDDVSAFTAPAPEGPWTYHGRVHTTPTGGLSTYGSMLPMGLPGVTGPTVVYSTNDFPFDSYVPPPSITVYGPRFVSPNPGSLSPP